MATSKNGPLEVPGWLTITVGVIFTLSLMVFFPILFWGVASNTSVPIFWLRLLVLAVEAWILFYFLFRGLVTIPIPYKGQVLFLGQRLGSWFPLLQEGHHWTLPRPLMYVEKINLEVRITKIEMSDVPDQNGVPVKFKLAIQWKIKDPFTFLSVGESVVTEGLQSMAKSTIRNYAKTMIVAEILKDEADLDVIKDGVVNPLEQAGDRVSENWGIDILSFLVEDIDQPDELKKEAIRIEREVLQRKSETANIETVVSLVEMLKTAGVNPVEAVRTVQTERGKQTRQEHIFSGEVSAALGGAAAAFIVKNLQNKPEKDEKPTGKNKKRR